MRRSYPTVRSVVIAFIAFLVLETSTYAQDDEFELVELNPLVDPGYTSAQNADRVLQECLTGIAMRKRGLTEPHYLSPLTVDHGHDQ